MQEDFYSIQTEQLTESSKLKECRALIAAILLQALRDAISNETTTQAYLAKRTALTFINTSNEVFCGYCQLLNLNPEYLSRKMQLEINRANQRN